MTPSPSRLCCDILMSMRSCEIAGCSKPHVARGWCRAHYSQWHRLGHPLGSSAATPKERITRRILIDETSGCWLWNGTLSASPRSSGYALVNREYAHRVSYEVFVGPIPEGLEIDHLCRIRHCVNPDHLEPVTRRENLLRGDTFAARNARKTHCPQGHSYSGENLYVYKGGRKCRTCHREAERRRRASS